MGNLAKIEHIVVLMLENRSFDSVLGTLYTKSDKFDGLDLNASNPLQGQPDVGVWGNDKTDKESMSIPKPDPGESWDDMNIQLFGLDGKPDAQPPAMNGFVNDYVRQTDEPAGSYDPKSVMHYYTQKQLPVIHQLAKAFGVCDQWFASAPCQTWPNRFFAHTGTAAGYENNSPTHFPYLMNTIFNRLEEAGKTWRVYYHDFPQALTLSLLWPHFIRFCPIEEFAKDAAAGTLPAYSFIEPRYFPDNDLPNDQHPPHHVGLGDELIADIYTAVRGAPTWNKSLLIVTYDEHGGCYDHAPPPGAIPPDNTNPQPFGFDRYGVRVPAVIISPYVSPGSIIRSPETLRDGTAVPFDHTSIIATIRRCFDLGASLTHRDAVAPDLDAALDLDAGTNNGPATVTPLHYDVTLEDIEQALAAPLNGMQKALHEAAAHLPPVNAARSVFDSIENHIESLVKGFVPAVPNNKTTGEAAPYVKDRLDEFLRGGS
jgi:phospholipase C